MQKKNPVHDPRDLILAQKKPSRTNSIYTLDIKGVEPTSVWGSYKQNKMVVTHSPSLGSKRIVQLNKWLHKQQAESTNHPISQRRTNVLPNYTNKLENWLPLCKQIQDYNFILVKPSMSHFGNRQLLLAPLGFNLPNQNMKHQEFKYRNYWCEFEAIVTKPVQILKGLKHSLGYQTRQWKEKAWRLSVLFGWIPFLSFDLPMNISSVASFKGCTIAKHAWWWLCLVDMVLLNISHMDVIHILHNIHRPNIENQLKSKALLEHLSLPGCSQGH